MVDESFDRCAGTIPMSILVAIAFVVVVAVSVFISLPNLEMQDLQNGMRCSGLSNESRPKMQDDRKSDEQSCSIKLYHRRRRRYPGGDRSGLS